jgi:ATP-dependent RNA helicase DDX60
MSQQEAAIRDRFSPAPLADFGSLEVGKSTDGNDVMARVVRDVLSCVGEHDHVVDCALLYIFTAHMVLLSALAVSERARRYPSLPSNLDEYLRSSFLPKAFIALERNYTNSCFDVDGRVFLDLLVLVLSQPSTPLSEILGEDVLTQVEGIWTASGSPALNFRAVSSKFRVPTAKSVARVHEPSVSVMPFQNDLFQEAISSVQAVVLSDDSLPSDLQESHVPFTDTRHWHNHQSAILPKHLGGEERVELTDWQRKRQLRSEQRFVAKMQWQAESLTGAMGRPLQRITIVSKNATGAKVDKSIIPQVHITSGYMFVLH